jgi:hypothetical protein
MFRQIASLEQNKLSTPEILKKLEPCKYLDYFERVNAKMILEEVNKEYELMIQKNDNEEIPVFFVKLFNCNSKKDQEKLIKSDEYVFKRFHVFIWNCEKLNFCYIVNHIEKPSSDVQDLSRKPLNPKSPTFAKDVIKHSNLLFDRKQNKKISWHLFESVEKPSEWHLFYFSWDDCFTKENHHKPNGVPTKHVHYVSHLFELDKIKTLQQIESGKYSFSSFHIKYNHYND